MITLDALNEFGANTDEGMNRCLNNEQFYFKMIKMSLKDSHFEELGAALEAKNLDAAFEAAHALKGVMATLALTPLLNPINQITDLLRKRTDTDYSALYGEMKNQREKLLSLLD